MSVRATVPVSDPGLSAENRSTITLTGWLAKYSRWKRTPSAV